ncbi:hypothetical protein E2C01_017375 [Portunus trituberculatus]|uniref:Uncharacterized protein n=1 Tax=Portunus trituberculatus TaxID=210409 RepID=A0A5B7DT77_PORTR|nr:hypothetical protein [Portunus trituberculatus]
MFLLVIGKGEAGHSGQTKSNSGFGVTPSLAWPGLAWLRLAWLMICLKSLSAMMALTDVASEGAPYRYHLWCCAEQFCLPPLPSLLVVVKTRHLCQSLGRVMPFLPLRALCGDGNRDTEEGSPSPPAGSLCDTDKNCQRHIHSTVASQGYSTVRLAKPLSTTYNVVV